MNIHKTIKNGKSNLKVYDHIGMEVSKPQSFLDKLVDIMSVNPVNFMLVDKKHRADIFLESLTLETSYEKIKEVTSGHDIVGLDNINFSDHALKVIDEVYSLVYDDRKIYNREAKEKQNSINQLRESIVEIDFDPEELDNELNTLEEKRDSWKSKKEEYTDNIKKQTQEKLEKLNQEFIKRKLQITQEEETLIGELNQSFSEKLEPLNERISQLRERVKFAGSALKTKQLIKQFNEEVNNLEELSSSCSTTLKKLEEYKYSLLSSIPIPGIEIKDGDIYKDGVVFDRLNTATQIQISVELAKLRAGDLGLICIDGIERFDNEAYELFKQEMAKTNLQTIITKVSDNDLIIKN